MFLTEQKSAFAEFFRNDAWVLKLCYLSDNFGKLNDLNIPLQRKNCNIISSESQISSYTKSTSFFLQTFVEKALSNTM